MKKIFIFLFFISCSFVHADEAQDTAESVLGTSETKKFSLHNPAYFIIGDDDLKLQFSFKYRLTKTFPLYFAYTQLMFWEIYASSKPFSEINYKPEIFYRLLDAESHSLKTLDIGYIHNSNGKDGDVSRSLDRAFMRGNYLTTYNRHHVDVNLTLFSPFNEGEHNQDIIDHYGYWELLLYFTDLIVSNENSLNLELKMNAGSKIYDLDQGGYQIGLIYDFHSKNFNPSLYLQLFEGYGESLIEYNVKKTEYRLGLLLTF